MAHQISFSFDGTRLTTVDTLGTVRLWDPVTATLLTTIESERMKETAVSWQPNGLLFSTVAAWGSSQVQIWNGETGELIDTVNCEVQERYSVRWRSDGTELLIASNPVQFWNADERTVDRRFTGISGDLYWSPDETLLVEHSSYALHGLEFTTNLRLFSADDGTLLASLSRTTSDYATSGMPPSIWDSDDSRLRFVTTRCEWSTPSCTLEVSTGFDASFPSGSQGIVVQDLAPDFTLGQFATAPSHIIGDPTGTRLTALVDETLYIWALGEDQGELLAAQDNVQLREEPYTGLYWSPDGSRLILQTTSAFEIFDIALNQVILSLPDATWVTWEDSDTLRETFAINEFASEYYLENVLTGEQTRLENWTLSSGLSRDRRFRAISYTGILKLFRVVHVD
jgi:WD40 repeat protein